MSYLPQGMPLPQPTAVDAPFWDAARRHELVVQRCARCGTFRHRPMLYCHNCQSLDHDWVKVSGKGTVYSYINVAHPVHPALAKRVPFNVVLVELPDAGGVRMVGNVLDATFEELYVGMPVEVAFEDIDEKTTLPQWQKASGERGGKPGR